MFSSGYKAVLCLLRRHVSHDDRFNAPAAGFLSAFSVALESNSRKSLFVILVLSRCIDSFINIIEENGYITSNRRLRYFMLWCLSSSFVIFLHVVRPELVNTGILKFYRKWAMASPQEKVAFFDLNERLWKQGSPGY